ncbi:phosphotransferase family protein [Variovorax sp. SRS16]|uniref:phosphotransferase family protein n=1 Tax=Variovorax sp. SRS16 TaxID=282217 RepID=UPI001E28CB73|nr:phosphotransferase family protein [Variovorax sp. SRS16]
MPVTFPTPSAADAALRARLARYLSAQAAAPVAVRSFRRLSAGLSWMTASFTADFPSGHPAPAELILKLGPLQGLMAPYSALPQALAGLSFAGSKVPVPTVRWHGDDEAALGGPFLICDRVDGDALNPFVPDFEATEPGDLPALGARFAQLLAHIHALDWRHAPIAALATARQDTHAAQELRFWRERAQRWSLRPVPMLELAGNWLARHGPANPAPCVVHGDYRVGNFLHRGQDVTAVLDWEMVHIGDHHEDIAWAFMPEFRLTGLVGLAEFKRLYADGGGPPLDDEALQYYTVFCLYKLAVINLGAAHGVEQGANDLRLACLGLTVSGYLERLGRALSKRLRANEG